MTGPWAGSVTWGPCPSSELDNAAFHLQVNETTLKVAASANPVYPSDQTTEEKQSTDSGAYSIGH